MLSKENMITFRNKIVLGIIQPEHKRIDKTQNKIKRMSTIPIIFYD